MKYMVMVNGKYMTQVEVDASGCAAEHVILDELRYGMKSALAFDAKAMRTQHFFDCFQSCEMVSLDELRFKSKRAKAQLEAEISSIERKIETIDQQIENLQSERKELGYKLNAARNQTGEAV